MQALALDAGRRFDDRLLRHLWTHFPEICGRLGQNGVRRAILYGIGRAREYQLTTERQIARYLNLQFAFGLHFDEQLPWAAATLDDLDEPAELRIDRLSEKATRYAPEARGITAEEVAATDSRK